LAGIHLRQAVYQEPKKWVGNLHRLTVGTVPPGGSPLGNLEICRNDTSPGGYSSSAKRFLEISQKLMKSRGKTGTISI